MASFHKHHSNLKDFSRHALAVTLFFSCNLSLAESASTNLKRTQSTWNTKYGLVFKRHPMEIGFNI
ncbi:hypothetical protein MTR_3g022732 [Medicago truncatula]|uniref:Uncharacterized protein n=1 Tax=Medicago truncatula TaxID=3880 RepID=A0A072UUN7_MEDTR|nr:hypothetical protein MTR_3g022732 [Medicago truncatula]